MDFSKKIYKYLETSKVLEVGEVKVSQAYLYGSNYEIVVKSIPKRKVVSLQVIDRKDNERKITLTAIGTINHVLNLASGYIRSYQ